MKTSMFKIIFQHISLYSREYYASAMIPAHTRTRFSLGALIEFLIG